ncbi:MAG: hypothetical protein IIB38_13225, partial [Candidatus Hydrogenedentes bacterium]|nr:hypothetical protein [Candidatus Hydrogenedentota bacterium]
MFSRSLVFSVLILSLAAFPLYGCSSSGSGAIASGLPDQALVSDGSGVSSWDVLLVGAETGTEFVFSILEFVSFTDRPITESWSLSFGPTGVLSIGMLGDNGCIDTVNGSYTFNGTTGTIDGSWIIVRTCDAELRSEGSLSVSLSLNTVTDTISGTFTLQLEGEDQFTLPFDSMQTGTFFGTRVAPPVVSNPDPGLVGDWSGLADLLTNGVRAGEPLNNQGGPLSDQFIDATFDAVGNVVFNVNVPGTAPITDPGCRDTYTFQYTYDGAVGQIFGAWFLIGDCEGDLVDTGSLVIDFISDGTLLTTAPSGSYHDT